MKKEGKKCLTIFYFGCIIILTNTINTTIQKQTKKQKFKNYWTSSGVKKHIYKKIEVNKKFFALAS
jgi:hypothetical protein